MSFWDSWPLIGKEKPDPNAERFKRQEVLTSHDYSFSQDLSLFDKATIEAQVRRGEDPVIPGTRMNVEKGLISQGEAVKQTPKLNESLSAIDNATSGFFDFIKRTIAKFLVLIVIGLFIFFLANNFIKRKLG